MSAQLDLINLGFDIQGVFQVSSRLCSWVSMQSCLGEAPDEAAHSDVRKSPKLASSLPNNICATLRSNPDLMNSPCLHIYPITHTIGGLDRILFFRVCDSQLALGDQMSGEALMLVWSVVGISVAKSALRCPARLC